MTVIIVAVQIFQNQPMETKIVWVFRKFGQQLRQGWTPPHIFSWKLFPTIFSECKGMVSSQWVVTAVHYSLVGSWNNQEIPYNNTSKVMSDLPLGNV